jgi:ABC-2 type transport system ATP-binding protein
LIGPSGCGKTTTVRMLTGIYRPTTGWATINGTAADRLSDRQRQRIGYLPQLPALFPDLSLWENLSFHASMYGLRVRRRRRLQQLLSWVELWEHRNKRIREVSGGMQRRLALAASFVHDPPTLFLDEPTAGIDPILRAKFWARFRELRESGRTILVTTQYVGEAAYCDLVGLLSDGELLGVDTPENLRRAAFAGDVVDVELVRRVEADELRAIAGLEFVLAPPEEVEPRIWRIVVKDADHALRELPTAFENAGLSVVDLQEHVVDFDEAFVRVIERARRRRAEGLQPSASGGLA